MRGHYAVSLSDVGHHSPKASVTSYLNVCLDLQGCIHFQIIMLYMVLKNLESSLDIRGQ